MLRKFSFSLLALTSLYTVSAQDKVTDTTSTAADEKAKPVISGYVDAYYRFNFSNPKGETGVLNNYTSFTNSQNSFELGMASVKLEHTIGKVGVVADLGFGKRAEEFSYNDDKTMLAIKQAYVTYSPVANLKLTAGSWATHVGYELVDPYLNRNYSMSHMFSYGPFFHTGVKADLTLGKSGFMIGLTNPTDFKTANFSRKFLVGQYSLSTVEDKLKFFLNYQGGNADGFTKMNQLDAVITGAISDKFSLGYNGTVQGKKFKGSDGKFSDNSSWWGSALYVNVDPKSWFGLTLREEYFSDKKGLITDGDGNAIFQNGSVLATTLSANFRVNGLTIIPEVRLDKSNKELYLDHAGNGVKSTLSGLLAVVYAF